MMKKNFKRGLALLLATALVSTSAIYTSGTYLKATGDETVVQEDQQAATQEEGIGQTSEAEAPNDTQEIVLDPQPELPQQTEQSAEEPPQVTDTQEPQDQKPEEEPQEEKEELKYQVLFKKPAAEGGVLKAWSDGNSQTEVTYDGEGKYTEEVTEGALYHFEISTHENYTVENVIDQNGSVIAPVSVNGNMYAYQMAVDGNKEISIIYKEVIQPKEEEKALASKEEEITGEDSNGKAAEEKEKNSKADEKENEKTADNEKAVTDKKSADDEKAAADKKSADDKKAADDKKEESTSDKTPEKPAKSYSQTVDGTVVTVDAPEGVLEDGWSLSVKAVSVNQVESAVASALDEKKEIAEIKAFDITILDKDGNEIQPDGTVTVSFSNVDVQGEELEVYHLDDSNKAAEQVGQTESSDAVELEAEHFSIYVIVGTQEKTAETIEESYTMPKGSTKTLSTKNSDKEKIWYSSDDSIVKLENLQEGSVTAAAIKSGKATVTHKYGTIEEKFYIEVTEENSVTNIEVTGPDNEMSTLDSPMQLKAVTTPAGMPVTWNTSDISIAEVSQTGLVTAKGVGKVKITASAGTVVSNEYEITVKEEYTITFKLNGGSGTLPETIRQVPGTEITMPEDTGLTKDGSVFVGWSRINNANAEGKYDPSKNGGKGTIYPAGTLGFTMPSENITLYATWSAQNVKAGFYIRLDGTIPTEPQGHANSEYTSAITIDNAIKTATFYTSTERDGVKDRLNAWPSDEDIKKVYENYNPDTQYVLWYVIKHALGGGPWHVDGVLLEKEKVTLSYNANAPSGTWSGMPDGQQYDKDSTATVSSKVPTRNGYTFKGWNTQADGKGISYEGNDTFTISEDTMIYAQWEAKGTTPYRIKYYYQEHGVYPDDTPYSSSGQGKTDTNIILGDSEKTPQKDGYVFDEKGDNVLEGTISAEEVLVLKVYFKQQFTVTYKPGSQGTFKQESYSSIEYDEKTPDFKGTITGKPGYIFEGWSPEIAEKVTKSVTYTATWKRVLSDVTVKPYEGEYDGQIHSVTISGNFDEDVIEYSTDQNKWYKTPISYKDVLKESGTAGEYPVYVKVSNGEVSQVIQSYIKITPKEVEITSASGWKEYDGTPLKKDNPVADIEVTAGKDFINGEGAAYVISGEQTDVGSSLNSFDYTLNNNTLEDNYQIKTNFGTLTVIKNSKQIIIKAKDGEKKYDGSPLTNQKYDYTQGILAEGDTLDVEIEGTITDVGTVSNRVAGYKVIRSSDHQEVTNYYTFGTPVNGTLSINKRDVILTSGSGEKTYDGTPLTNDHVEVTGDRFVGNEGATYVVTGSQTLAGQSDNEYTYELKSNTKLSNYNITKKTGTLTVNQVKEKIVITANNNNKKYDGSPLTDDGYTYTDGILIKGDELTATVEGSITDAGTAENVVQDYKVMHGDTDVTSCYSFGTSVNGKLSVTQRTVYLNSEGGNQVYNGKVLTNDKITVSGDGFIGDEGATYVVSGTQTDVGESLNTFSYELKDGTKSQNYIIIPEEGKLIVTPKPLTITAGTASKPYDGVSLTNSEYTNGELADQDVIESVKLTGSQLDVGSSKNVASDAVIKREGRDVTNNYDIQYIEGDLTVTANENTIVITAGSAGKTYDGEPLTESGYTYTQDVLAEGDILTATVEGSITDYGTAENKVIEYKVMRGNQNVTGNYTFAAPVNGTLKIAKRKVTLTSATDSKTYNGEALTNSDVIVTGDGFAKGEGADYHVTGSQTDVGDSLNTFTYHLKDGTKEDNYQITPEEGSLTVTPITAEIIITAGNDNRIYNGKALSNGSYSYTENILLEGDELTATLEGSLTDVGQTANKVTDWKVMRGGKDITGNYTFGQPIDGVLEVTKRYVSLASQDGSKVYDGTALTNENIIESGNGFVDGEGALYDVTGSQLIAGESVNTFDYSLDEGTKADNYEIDKSEGLLTVTPITTPITIKAESDRKLYDGSALSNDGYTYTDNVLLEDDMLDATVEGTITDAGTQDNIVTGYRVMHGDLDVTECYTFTQSENGLLTVDKREITLTSLSSSKTYDGTALTNRNIKEEGDGFVDGEGLQSDATGSQLEVGKSANTFEYTFNNGTSPENYNVTEIEGTLEVTPITAEITISAVSGSKVYDGTELKNAGYKYTANVLPKGHELQVTVVGSQTDAGSSSNIVEEYKVIRTSDGKDVTSYFNFASSVNGILEVTPKDVTVTVNNAVKVYGEEDPEFDGFIEGLIRPEDLTVSYNRDAADKSKENVGDDITVQAEYTDNPNYNITVIPGKLTIVKSDENAITATGTTVTYDGTEHGLTDVSVLREGSKVTYSTDGENWSSVPPVFTEAGTYTIYVKAEHDSYEDVIAEATVIINQRALDIQAGSASKIYDGTPLVATTASIVNGTTLAEGHEVSRVTVLGSQTEVGSSENVASYAEITDGDKDVTANYAIRYIDGLLTVTTAVSVPSVTPPAPITPTAPTTPTTPAAPTPTAPITPVTPAAAAPAAVTPITPAAAPAALTQLTPPAVPLANQNVQVDDTDEGYDLTSVADTEIPLANKTIDDHVCCILHFLLMLLALIVLGFYTRSMKKRQARIFELREELELEMLKKSLEEEKDDAELTA